MGFLFLSSFISHSLWFCGSRLDLLFVFLTSTVLCCQHPTLWKKCAAIIFSYLLDTYCFLVNSSQQEKFKVLIHYSFQQHLLHSSKCFPHGVGLICHPMPARIPCPWDFPGKNTGVSCRSLLQGIFLTQGSNPHLLHCRQILYHWATREAPGLALTMRIFPQQSKLKSWKNHYCTYLSIRREGKLHHIEAENS